LEYLVKHWLKRTTRRLNRSWRRFSHAVGHPLDIKRQDEVRATNQILQILLAQQYQGLARTGAPLPSFREVEFRNYSQFGEDGILLYLFALLGTTNQRCVEICAGNGIECNCANLIVNHGWEALLFDGNPEYVQEGREFYGACPDTMLLPPRFVSAWITRDNVNELIRANGFEGEIDLLSLDMDGMDYWIWESISVVQPRVVVLEYQNCWGPEDAYATPYAPEYRATGPGGASLAAFIKLAEEKHYRLVGTHRYSFNAFFVRDQLARDVLPTRTAEECLNSPFARLVQRRWAGPHESEQWVPV
jgi:hypothetical protein